MNWKFWKKKAPEPFKEMPRMSESEVYKATHHYRKWVVRTITEEEEFFKVNFFSGVLTYRSLGAEPSPFDREETLRIPKKRIHGILRNTIPGKTFDEARKIAYHHEYFFKQKR